MAIKTLALIVVLVAYVPNGFAATTKKSIFVRPGEFVFTHETIRYAHPTIADDHEIMGMASISLNLKFDNHLYFGIANYGATTGIRGGFINNGINSGYNLQLTESILLKTELFVGGGGGSSAHVLVGGGAMIRPSTALMYEMDEIDLGLGASYVTFPNGSIHSSQLFLASSFPTEFAYVGKNHLPKNEEDDENDEKDVLKPDIFRMTPGLRLFRTKNLEVPGPPSFILPSKVYLIGFNGQRFFKDSHAYSCVDLYAPFTGGIAGFMTVSVGSGYELQLAKFLDIDADMNIGYAGGGGVDTAGGLTFEPRMASRIRMTEQAAAVASVGYLVAPSSKFKATTLTFGFSKELDSVRPEISRDHLSEIKDVEVEPVNFRFGVTEQRYLTKGIIDLSRTRPLTDIDLLGLDFDYMLNKHLYAAASTYWAYGGNAGSYAAGLLGVILHQSVTKRTFVEARFDGGAGAGGAIPVGDAAVLRGQLGVGFMFADTLSLNISAGKIRFIGGIAPNTIEIGLYNAVAVPTRSLASGK